MSKLQNNFTTPEQSKRLLELGVPANSADCYISFHHLNSNSPYEVGVLHNITFTERWYNHPRFLPCWSVGQLIEIYDMCFIYPKSRSSWCAHTRIKGVLYVNYILDCYKNAIADKLLDFSKLEEDMTDEQIKQNAEEYASKLVERDYHEDMWLDLYDAYIAGAHSRDEEIVERLQNQIEELSDQLKMNADNIQKLLIQKHRNLWISVEERMPDPHTPVYAKNDKRTWFFALRTDNRVRPWYDIVGRHPEEVTHWKPIQELKGGEK